MSHDDHVVQLMKFERAMAAKTRGSHIHTACRNVCDRDQNGIKRSTFFSGANQGIKTNSEQLISMHFLRYYGGVAMFCPLNSRISAQHTMWTESESYNANDSWIVHSSDGGPWGDKRAYNSTVKVSFCWFELLYPKCPLN